jgi:hypothetical protein
MHNPMKTRTALSVLIIAALCHTTYTAAQGREQEHNSQVHHQGVMERGQQGMGFDQQSTSHHFVLLRDGGLVQVQANSAADKAGIAQIRSHLREIKGKFAKGDFDVPEFIHAQTPPGVFVMQQKKESIRYSYATMARGAQLRISSKDAKVVAAIHDFLRFQITDHKTGDPLQVGK